MALTTTTIGELNPGGPLQGIDIFVIERIGGNNFRITSDEIKTFIGTGLGLGHVIEDEGTPLTQRSNLNFVGAGVTVTDADPDTIVTIPGGVGSAYEFIQDEGTPLSQENTINFVGAGVVASTGAGVTTVTIQGGIASASLATLTDVNLTGQAVGGLIVNVDGTNWEDLPVGSNTEVLTIVGGIPTWAADTGGGEINLGANVGAGTGLVFRDKIGVTLNFKSLIGGTNITVVNLTDDIQFNVPHIYTTILDEGTPITQRTTLNFAGVGVTVTDFGGDTLVTIPGGIAEAYATIQDEGTPVTQENTINFVGAGVVATAGAGVTTVTIAGGIGSLTPWTENIDGAGFALSNVNDLSLVKATGGNIRIQFVNQNILSDDSVLGFIDFEGIDDDTEQVTYGKIAITQESDVTGSADGSMKFFVAENAGPEEEGSLYLVLNDASSAQIEALRPIDMTTNNIVNLPGTFISALSEVTAISGDFILISDTTDSGNLKKVNASDFLSAGSQTPWIANQDAVNFNLSNLDTLAFNGFGSAITGIDTITMALNGDISNFDFLARSGIVSSAGVLRLNNGNDIAWRNSLNTANNVIAFASGDVFSIQIGLGTKGNFRSGPTEFVINNDFVSIADGASLITLEINRTGGLGDDVVIGHHDFRGAVGEESNFVFVRNVATVEGAGTEDGSYKITMMENGVENVPYMSFNDAANQTIVMLRDVNQTNTIGGMFRDFVIDTPVGDGTIIGETRWRALDGEGSPVTVNYVRIYGEVENDDIGSEDGSYHIRLMENGDDNVEYLRMNSADYSAGKIFAIKPLVLGAYLDTGSGSTVGTTGRIRLESNAAMAWAGGSFGDTQIIGVNGGFKISDHIFLVNNSSNPSPLEYRMDRSTILTADTEIGRISAYTPENDGSSNDNTQFAAMIITMEDRAVVDQENASFKFEMFSDGSMDTYLSMNDASSGTIDMFKDLDMNSNNITADVVNVDSLRQNTTFISSQGFIRMDSSGAIQWRNTADDGDISLTISNDALRYSEIQMQLQTSSSDLGKLSFTQNTVLANDTDIATFDFITKDNDGSSFGNLRYVYLQAKMESRSIVDTEEGSYHISMVEAGTPDTPYMTFNDASSHNIEILKPLSIADGIDIIVGTTTGTKFGTSATQKIGFFDATPIIQPIHIADASGGATIDAEARTAINALLAQIASIGLQASS